MTSTSVASPAEERRSITKQSSSVDETQVENMVSPERLQELQSKIISLLLRFTLSGKFSCLRLPRFFLVISVRALMVIEEVLLTCLIDFDSCLTLRAINTLN